MLDRIPLPSIAGLLDGFVDIDVPIGTLPANSRVQRVVFVVNEPPSGGSVTGSVRTATGGGGSGIAATIADGLALGEATGDVLLAAPTVLYLRFSAVTGTPIGFSGWIEIEEGALAAVTGELTTLERVKRFLNVTSSTDDVLMNELIAGVSAAWRQATRRTYAQVAYTNERLGNVGLGGLVTRWGPILSIEELREDAAALAATDYEFDGRVVYRLSDDLRIRWDRSASVQLDYTAGFVAVPEQVVAAVTMQVAHLFHQSQPGGGRLGMNQKGIDAGGGTSYAPDSWLPFVRGVIETERELLP